MKLSEVQLKPLFLKVHEWANILREKKNSSPSALIEFNSRSFTFYTLMELFAIRLRSIFVPYFGYVLRDVAALLETPFTVPKEKASRIASAQDYIQLKQVTVAALNQCFKNKGAFVA